MDILQTWLCKTPIAHRGLYNRELPENSLAAFENAVKAGFPIELDVRLANDGTIVVFHDEKLGRMTDCDGYVSNLDFEDLKEIKLLKTDQHIPTFEQVLELVNGKVPLLIELKGNRKNCTLEGKLIDMLNSYTCGEYAVEAFDPKCMEYFFHNAPNIVRGQLSRRFTRGELPHRERAIISKLKCLDISRPDFIAYKADNLPNRYTTSVDLPVIAWTVCSENQAAKILNHSVNYIFDGFIPAIKV